MFDLWHFLAIFVVLFVTGRVNIWLYHWNNQRQDKKFLKALQIQHPDSSISLVTVSGRDDVALRKIKEQLSQR